jgi:peroxiredoxin Q/BCP
MPKKKPQGPEKNANHPLAGKKAPDFTLEETSGKRVSLKNLLGGKALVLYFYPKDMTTGCTKEACDFRDNLKGLSGQGATVIGVSPDAVDSHQRFTGKFDLNFPLLADPQKQVAKLYGVWKKKSLYGREFMGIERTTFLIDKAGTVRKVFPKVRVDGHAEKVIQALKELD